MSEVQNDFSWKNLFDYFGMQRKFNFLNCIFHLNDTNSFLGIYNLIKFLLLMYQMCTVTCIPIYVVYSRGVMD